MKSLPELVTAMTELYPEISVGQDVLEKGLGAASLRPTSAVLTVPQVDFTMDIDGNTTLEQVKDALRKHLVANGLIEE